MFYFLTHIHCEFPSQSHHKHHQRIHQFHCRRYHHICPNENHQCRHHHHHVRNLDDHQLTHIHCGGHVHISKTYVNTSNSELLYIYSSFILPINIPYDVTYFAVYSSIPPDV
uniref:Uncharacterized protein n=1 Tax=Schistosoma mansoni TaxID=6183 RepID=A0A5K4F770_SCHMA